MVCLATASIFVMSRLLWHIAPPLHYHLLRTIPKMTNVKQKIATLHALDYNVKNKPEVLGKTKIPVADNNGKYAMVDLKPNRSSIGVSKILPKKLNSVARDWIRAIMRRCKEAA